MNDIVGESASSGAANTNYSNAFDYDGMGNRTRVENVGGGNASVTRSTPNELNQLTALSSSVNGAPAQTSGLSYDKAGNTSFITNPDESRSEFTYDDADRLTRIEKRSAADAPLSKSEFVYDFASRKAISREFTRTGGAWGVTDEKRRVFDGLDVIQERNSANEVTAQLVRDGNIGGILARSNVQGATFFGYDGGGNVTLLTDANGDDVGRYRYDAFGNTLEAVGPRAGENPYRFSTKELHAASGLYDFGFRFYSASLGRWINRDPIEEEGGLNLYAMVGNSPTNSVDDYGLDAMGDWYEEEEERRREEERGRQQYLQNQMGGGIAGGGRGRARGRASGFNWGVFNLYAWWSLMRPTKAGPKSKGLGGRVLQPLICRRNRPARNSGTNSPTKKNITVNTTRKKAKDTRVPPPVAKTGGKRVTSQTRKGKGASRGRSAQNGNKSYTDGGTQRKHMHDANHGRPGQRVIPHYRIPRSQ